MKSQLCLLCLAMIGLLPLSLSQEAELVYAEMEFPLSFEEQVQEYAFNPLLRFQTDVEGRLIELTCDALVDLFQVGRTTEYRPCLGTWRTMNLRSREVLNFNLADARWPDGKPVTFSDVWFSLQYRKTNPLSWGGSENLNIEKKGEQSLDAYLNDSPQKAPKVGEFYFPIVNQSVFHEGRSPARARVNKQRQNAIGYGRYSISQVEENQHILLTRRKDHPYYQNLEMPEGCKPIDKIRMHAFPRARIQRNAQFVEGRVHIITSATQQDVDWIINSYPETRVSRYYDDSFTSFVFNCDHPLLRHPAARRALNYAYRKKIALDRALRGQGVIISGPLPGNSSYYNLEIPPYQDDVSTAIAILKLYRDWGMDVCEEKKRVTLLATPTKGPGKELESGDQILRVEMKQVTSAVELLAEFIAQGEEPFRVTVERGPRHQIQRIYPGEEVDAGEWKNIVIGADRLENFPELSLIANNPEGKNDLVKEICGSLKEDLAKIGIPVKIDYLDGRSYYPRMQKGDFDLALRTVKLSGTPNLYRMFYKQSGGMDAMNVNYGGYHNAKINELASSTKNITSTDILIEMWKTAHRVLHHDPPYIYLWSRRHILLYTDRLEIVKPGPAYQLPYSDSRIVDGLIDIFNEVHLWGLRD